MNKSIILASASPRRKELLESAGIKFKVVPGDIDETILHNEKPLDYVLRLAEEKAKDVAARAEARFFIGADTIVVCNDEIMGKPLDSEDAVRMLKKLSGKPHKVVTGFAVYDSLQKKIVQQAVTTDVFFKELTDDEINRYVATKDPLDKAGAYAIQGGAAYMVKGIQGSYTNVVGLPLTEVIDALKSIDALEE
ncbi:MAG: Maf family nucleotide pyrophosphatase [Desulfuromonadales bacterium]|nr:Maf family nucleotide pyrophosphatase [Desulfuromonadales bacterium]